MVYIIALFISENPFTFRTSATTLNVCKRNNKIDQMNQGLFRCASISCFQVVSQWVIDVFTASASTGLLELFYVSPRFWELAGLHMPQQHKEQK